MSVDNKYIAKSTCFSGSLICGFGSILKHILFIGFIIFGCATDENDQELLPEYLYEQFGNSECIGTDMVDLKVGDLLDETIVVGKNGEGYGTWAAALYSTGEYKYISYSYSLNTGDRIVFLDIHFYLDSREQIIPGSYVIKTRIDEGGQGVVIEYLDDSLYTDRYFTTSADNSTFFFVTGVTDREVCGSFRVYSKSLVEYLEGEFILSLSNVD